MSKEHCHNGDSISVHLENPQFLEDFLKLYDGFVNLFACVSRHKCIADERVLRGDQFAAVCPELLLMIFPHPIVQLPGRFQYRAVVQVQIADCVQTHVRYLFTNSFYLL